MTFDFHAHLTRQKEFSARTFGRGKRTEGICEHIRKEIEEVLDSGGDLREWIDLVILSLDGALRASPCAGAVIAALVAKQEKNEGRKWPDWREVPHGKPIEHVRDGSGED
jgi:hypothetical protein